MLVWYFIVWFDRAGEPREYSVMRTKPEFVADEMDNYLKFASAIQGGVAYEIKSPSGKPNFRTEAKRVGLPF